MPKRAAGLSARQVQTMKRPGMFADGNGLYLQITRSGGKTWVFRFTMDGKRRDMGLGSAGIVTLAEARQKALDAKKRVVAGIDPIEARRSVAAAQAVEIARTMTFQQCASAYIEAMRSGWKSEKHAGQWTATLETYAFPTIGALPVGSVDTNLVVQVLEPLWNTKTETASRLRGRIESVLNYAKVRGYRDGENPARWRGHLDHILPAKSDVMQVQHHPALPYAEMPAFWQSLQAQQGLGARALELAILTAGRTGEVLGAAWTEIDLETKMWTVPAHRMKVKVEHRVPISDPAGDLLRRLREVRRTGCELVFEGQSKGRPLSNMAMTMVLRRMKVPATAHGFRSTFRTWVAETTRFPDAVAEAALAHTLSDKVVAAYQRGDLFDKRRALMDAWAGFCIGGSKTGADVISINGGVARG
ncbi:MAG: integrase arm-type DNA-binding domain-containing protein [Alphaproteobacteria bacterium]|nr:integrase arm-type DNA-binding domain-containing protein [Alphaproteobacteria bacterium]